MPVVHPVPAVRDGHVMNRAQRAAGETIIAAAEAEHNRAMGNGLNRATIVIIGIAITTTNAKGVRTNVGATETMMTTSVIVLKKVTVRCVRRAKSPKKWTISAIARFRRPRLPSRTKTITSEIEITSTSITGFHQIAI